MTLINNYRLKGPYLRKLFKTVLFFKLTIFSQTLKIQFVGLVG